MTKETLFKVTLSQVQINTIKAVLQTKRNQFDYMVSQGQISDEQYYKNLRVLDNIKERLDNATEVH